MKRMTARFLSSFLLVSALFLVCSVQHASAQNTTTFAQTTDLSGQNFSFDGDTDTFTGSGLTLFTYLVPNGYGSVPTFVESEYSMTGQGTLTGSASNGSIDISSLDVTFTAQTPINGYSNLLSVDYAGGENMSVSGQSASTNLSNPPSAILFTSDFLSFANVQQENLGIALSSVISSGNTFTGSPVFTFASTPSPTSTVPSTIVPEPNSALVIGIMIACVGIAIVCRTTMFAKKQLEL